MGAAPAQGKLIAARALTLVLLAGCAHAPRQPETGRLAQLLSEAVRFETYEGNPAAVEAQKKWLLRTAAELGLEARDAGPVTEIELRGPKGAPVLGLVVHGDVQPAEAGAWSAPPFAGVVRDGVAYGRGVADDKGPLVQALLAMQALRGAPLTHTIRLLVGSDEESDNLDMDAYLAAHEAPAFSLVLDAVFPAVVGEKAWDGLAVAVDDEAPRESSPFSVVDLEAGLSPSIVPDRARLLLRGTGLPALAGRLRARTMPQGTSLELVERSSELEVIAHGKSAHSGMNLEGGRNALLALAQAVDGELPECGAADLLAFARIAGADLKGSSLGLATRVAPGWDGWGVTVATVTRHIKTLPELEGKLTMVINLRRPPPMTAAESRDHLFAQVRRLAPRLRPAEFWFKDETLSFNPEAKLVRRLMDDYARVTGERPPPAIMGGGTYAKRIPRAIAFGMWFPDKPYPGHDVDEQITLKDLARGLDVLVETVRDLATSPPLAEPFAP